MRPAAACPGVASSKLISSLSSRDTLAVDLWIPSGLDFFRLLRHRKEKTLRPEVSTVVREALRRCLIYGLQEGGLVFHQEIAEVGDFAA
jgi:hypothetical protein